MKHLKTLTGWLAESTGLTRLIELGLTDPEDHARVHFYLKTDSLSSIWTRANLGHDDIYPALLNDDGEVVIARVWIVPKGYEAGAFRNSAFDYTSGRVIGLDEMFGLARQLQREEFIDRIDELVHEDLVGAILRSGDGGPRMVISERTGKVLP